jgi:hypothetical protein
MTTTITRAIYSATTKSRIRVLISFAASLHIANLRKHLRGQCEVTDNAFLHADYLEAAARNADRMANWESRKEVVLRDNVNEEIATILGS